MKLKCGLLQHKNLTGLTFESQFLHGRGFVIGECGAAMLVDFADF